MLNHMLVLAAVAAIGLTVGSVDAAPKETPKGFLLKTIKSQAKEIKYAVYVPPTYSSDTPMPAIIFLNGAGECGTDGLKQIAVGLAPAIMFNVQDWPFIVIFPQKQTVAEKWEDEDAIVMDIYEKTRREYKIDTSRVYLTGLSQGGHGTFTIAANHPEMFAAIAPVCGWADKGTGEKIAKLPVWIFHGDQDQAVDVKHAHEMEEYIKAAGGDPKLTIYPGVNHNSWDKAYREEKLFDWFLRHHR